MNVISNIVQKRPDGPVAGTGQPGVSGRGPRPAALRLPDGRWHALEVGFWLLPLASYLLFPDHLVLVSQIMIAGLFALSLDLLLGYAGIISMGHVAYFGLGAYTAGLLSVHGWGDPLSGLVAAALTAALFGYLMSFLVVRGHALARLMVAPGIGLMLFDAANKATGITGGVDRLSGMSTRSLLGTFELGLYGKTAFWYCLGVVFVVFAALRRLVQSPFGLSLRGIREAGKRMPSIGAHVGGRLRAAYTIGAAVAGVAGVLLAQTTQFFGLDTLYFTRLAELPIMLVLGGAGRLYGALVGAAVFMVAHHYVSDLDPA